MDDDIIKLISLTLLLDLLLLFILLSQSLKVSDTCFVYNVFLSHFIFLYSLCYGHQLFIDFCHYSLFLLLLISPLILHNLYILCVCLFLVFMIQFLWVVEGRCILNKEGDFFFWVWQNVQHLYPFTHNISFHHNRKKIHDFI
jgi:hypothetical protein